MNHDSGEGPASLHATRPHAHGGTRPEAHPAQCRDTHPDNHPDTGVDFGGARAAKTGVFLHTGWRSSGTWLWSRCRQQPDVHAFYEPLHEANATLRLSDIPKLRPGNWRSRHGETAPYFAEYGKLIAPRRAGVPLYQRRFAFERFFLQPGDADPELEAYLRGLLAANSGTAAGEAAGGAGAMAALKFCRSLGRVGWMEQRFPEMLHAVVLRDPLDQWRSARRLLTEERNRYFTVAPLLVLARNAGHPLVRQACEALGVQLPALGSPDMAYGVETVWRHVKHQDAATQYRGFLAYWTATAVAALQSRALLIDTALLARTPEHRAAVEAAFAARLGGPVDLTYAPVTGTEVAGPDPADMRQAHADAGAFVQVAGAALAPPRLARLVGCLAVTAEMAAPRRTSVQVVCASPPQARPGLWAQMNVAVQVAFARALQPLRRLHGEMTRRGG